MLVSCWSAKGGSGTTVVAAAMASLMGARHDHGALLVDLGGDLPTALGVPEPDGPGLAEWLAAGASVPADALARLEVPVRPGLRLLPRGRGALGDPDRAEVLAALLAGDPRSVVVDVGVVAGGPGGGPAAEVARVLAASATQSLLVTRCCYLSARRVALLSLRPSGVVLLTERGRSLGPVGDGGPPRGAGGGRGPDRPRDLPGRRLRAASAVGCPVPSSGRCAMPPDAGDGLVEVLHRGLLDRAAPDESPAAQRALLRALARDRDPLLPGSSVESVVERVRARVDGLGPLEPLLADPSVDEVMLNGEGRCGSSATAVSSARRSWSTRRTALALIERIVAPLGLRVDRSSPLVDARLPDGSRVNAVVRPLAVDGPCLTIRRFGARAVGLAEVGPSGHGGAAGVGRRLPAPTSWCAAAPGAGKTTLLNALAAEIPDHDRVVTVEDAAELRLPGRHVVRLEARPAGAEGNGEVRIRDLVRNALRMRPDRIVVGEVRAGEALDMLQAMNTGHEGSLSTCHANSPADALRRLETLVLMGDVALPLAAVREQVRSALDLVVQISRRPDGSRRVTAVAEVEASGEAGEALSARALTDRRRAGWSPCRCARRGRRRPPPRRPTWIEAGR